MDIRQLRSEDFDAKIALSEFAFQYKLPPERLEAERAAYRPENDWGAFDGQGRLLSKLVIHPLETWVNGKTFAMGGIASVATWPEARRQGCVSKLLVHSFGVMRSSGQTISMLHPFEFPFYRKYGYEMTIERKRYEIETRLLPQRKETPGSVERMEKPDIAVLNGVYEKAASRYNGTLVRTDDWWERRVLSRPGVVAVYRSEENVAEGYIHYEVASRALTINDWEGTTEAARTALWTFVGNHDSMIDKVVLFAPMDDELPFLLANPRIKQEVVPYFMSRIVDAEGYVAAYPFASGDRSEEIAIALADPHAPWNEGTFKLSIAADGTARLKRIDGAADASFDVQSLTALLAGNRSAVWLAQVGRISGTAEALDVLERRVPRRTTYLMDFF